MLFGSLSIVFITFISLTLTAPQARATTSGLVTNSMLADACKSNRYQQQGSCEGYVMGVGEVITHELGYRNDLNPVCVPNDMDWPDVFEKVMEHLAPVLILQSGLARGKVEQVWSRAFDCIPTKSGAQPRKSVFWDAFDLKTMCASSKSREQGACKGYLIAIFERLPVVDAGEPGCLPPGLTGSALAKRVSRRIAGIDENSPLFAWLGDDALSLVRRTIEVLWARPAETCKLLVKL